MGLIRKPLGKFANENLKFYNKWEFLDRLFVLRPNDFSYSYKWRLDAEKRMGKGMSEEQIKDFVKYFMEAIDPNEYYNHLYHVLPPSLALEFLMNDNHEIDDVRIYN